MSDQMPEACPFCGAGVQILCDGRECRAQNGTFIAFRCGTGWFKNTADPTWERGENCHHVELAAVTAERDRLRERVALLQRIGNRMVGWCNDPRAANDWRMAMDPTQTAIPCQDCDGTGIAAGCDCPDCGGSGIAGWRAAT